MAPEPVAPAAPHGGAGGVGQAAVWWLTPLDKGGVADCTPIDSRPIGAFTLMAVDSCRSAKALPLAAVWRSAGQASRSHCAGSAHNFGGDH